jgi:hypothetical protein
MAAKRGGQHAGERMIAEHSDAARHAATLPKYARIRQLGDMKDSRRRRPRVIEPVDHRCRPHVAHPNWAARCTRLEAVDRSDVIKIQQRAFIMLARTCLDPLLLLGARTSRIDPKTYLVAGCEIERVSRATHVDVRAALAICP